MEATDIDTIDHAQHFCEGLINDYDLGICDHDEVIDQLKKYTLRLLGLNNESGLFNKKTISLELTKRQAWMLNYLHLIWCENKDRWVSPTEIGKEYGAWLHHDKEFIPHSYHSAAASPTLKKLLDKGIIQRNEHGLYRYCAELNNKSVISNKMVEFITFVTGHDADTIRQLYKDWNK